MDELHRERLEQTLIERGLCWSMGNDAFFPSGNVTNGASEGIFANGFLTCIDQYNLETDTPEKVQPYF